MGRLGVSCRRKMFLPKMSCFSKQQAAMLRDVPRRPSKPQTDLMCSHSCSFPHRSWCVVTRAHSQSLLSARSCTKFLSRISVSDTDAFVLSDPHCHQNTDLLAQEPPSSATDRPTWERAQIKAEQQLCPWPPEQGFWPPSVSLEKRGGDWQGT